MSKKDRPGMMVLTHKVALEPTDKQASRMRGHCGAARTAWNWGLKAFEQALASGQWLSDKDLRPRLNAVKDVLFPWMREYSQSAGKNALIDLGKATQRWGDYRQALAAGKKPRHYGFPRPRTRRRSPMSYQADNGPDTIEVDGKRIALPKVGWVRMREELRFAGSIRKVVVKQDRATGRWFACISVRTPKVMRPPTPVSEHVGVDVGSRSLATVVDETDTVLVIENPRALVAHEEELRKLDKAIARSRSVHGKNKQSNRRDRLYRKRRRLHRRIADIRADAAHKGSLAITKQAGRVTVEALNVAGMMRSKRVSKDLSDAAMSQLLAHISYKAEYFGRELVEADRFYPSTKTCWHCGGRNEPDSAMVYDCDHCGRCLQRDINAARNLRDLGLEPAQVAPRRREAVRRDSADWESGLALSCLLDEASTQQQPWPALVRSVEV